MKDIMSQFNLPSYLKGKTFAEASKILDDKFKDRTDKESVETMNELQGRLKEAQEHVKSKYVEKNKPQQAATDSPLESLGAGANATEPGSTPNELFLGGPLNPNDPNTNKKSTTYPENPNDLINSFKSNREARDYANPYPERSNRWNLLNQYQSDLKNKSFGVSGGKSSASRSVFGKGNGNATVQFQGKSMTGAQINEEIAKRGPVDNDNTEAIQNAVNNSLEGGGFTDFMNGEGEGPGAAGYIQAAGGAMKLANMAFGDSGIDTSGATSGPDVNVAGKAVDGAMTGAQAGGAIVPGWGHAIGAVVGGTAGLFGGNKAKKDADKANINNTGKIRAEGASRYLFGGDLDSDIDPEPEFDFQADNDNFMAAQREGGPYADPVVNTPAAAPAVVNPRKQAALNEAKKYSVRPESTTKGKNTASEEGGVGKYAELLRYAPVAMNAAQLAGLEKPGRVSLDRNNTKYEKQLVDEQGLQNTVRQATASNRDALLSSSGGSGSRASANLLASQLQGTKALSSAYQQAGESNKQEGRTEQQFNNANTNTNINQSNQETNLNLEQEAAYRTNKSKLLSQIGTSAGDIGKEEMYKRFPELMGLNYNYKGTHKSKTRKKKKKD